MPNIINPFVNFNNNTVNQPTRYDNISSEDKNRLYTKVKHILGYPNRPVELTEEQMDTYLEVAMEDYSAFLNSWLIQQNWGNLQYLMVSTSDFMLAYTSKTLDFERSFSLAYSKQVGLGNDAPSHWELKKDYVIVEEDQQVYTIPANREVNEVLWNTPPFVSGWGASANDPAGWTMGNGGWNYFGNPAQVMQPAYTALLNANDLSLKKRIMGSELTYRITAGANGTKNLYLYPVPGDRNEITTYKNPKHKVGTYVWYFYYDTNPQNTQDCLEQNKDVILMPSQVPLKNMTWKMMNDTAQSRIRKLLVAECKMALGQIRGFNTGEVKTRDFQITLDYRHLLEEGDKEKTNLFEDMKIELEKITFKTLMEERASIAQSTNIVMQFIPFKEPIMKM